MSDQWLVSDGTRQTGPHSHAELSDAFSTGRIPSSVMVWQQGWAAWEPAAQHFSEAIADPLSQLAAPPHPASAPRRRRKYKDPLASVQLILLIAVVAGMVTGISTSNFSLVRESGWGLIAVVVLVIVSRIMRGAWENSNS